MNDFEKTTLRDLIDDERASGVDGIRLIIIVYTYAFDNFNPADKGEIDEILRDKGLYALDIGDARLPKRRN